MNARLSIPAKSGVFPQASILWESSGAEEGLRSSGEPGTPAAALGLLGILNSSSLRDFERISVTIPTCECCVAAQCCFLSVCLWLLPYTAKGCIWLWKYSRKKRGSYLFVPSNRSENSWHFFFIFSFTPLIHILKIRCYLLRSLEKLDDCKFIQPLFKDKILFSPLPTPFPIQPFCYSSDCRL